ncbi:unnamed protein product [Zymoseptoria tritici ST99CH_1E4]|uniref:Uncharacterized protein n=1 Tax=Zymoseptoria tritici ST99CH_1E4 TaxID=1276532 RepID=A0A2H1GF26_ZYMTR|nr:unnamed protein product [Zymoseptoria tritici ST99CH_1E4]
MARSKQQARKNGGGNEGAAAKFTPAQQEAKRAKAKAATAQQKATRQAKLARQAMKAPAVHGGSSQTNGNPNKITLPGQDPNQNMNPHAGLTKKQKKALNKAAQEQQSNPVMPPGLTKKQRKAQARQQEAAREKNLLEERQQLKQDPMYEPSDSGAQQDHQMKGSGEGDDEYEPPEAEEFTKRVTRSQVSSLPRRPAKLRAQDVHTAAGQQQRQEAQVQIQRPVWQSHTDTPAQLQRELKQAAAIPSNASSSNQMRTAQSQGLQTPAAQLVDASSPMSVHPSQTQAPTEKEKHLKKVGNKWLDAKQQAQRNARIEARAVRRAEKRQKKKEALGAAQRAQGASGAVDLPSRPSKLHYTQTLANEERKIAQDEANGSMVDGKDVSKKALQVAESVRYQELAEKGVVMANFELMKGRTTFPLDFWEDLAGTKMAAMSRGVGVYM